MSRSLWPLLAIILIAGTACQQQIDIDKEKEAIMAVLKEEGDAIVAMDKERVFAVHVQDDLETRLELGIYGYNSFVGWDEVKTLLGDFTEGEWHGTDPVNRKENVIIKVSGNSAWLTCDNSWKWSVDGVPGGYENIQIAFLEKIKGEWKISFAAYYSKPEPMTGHEGTQD